MGHKLADPDWLQLTGKELDLAFDWLSVSPLGFSTISSLLASLSVALAADPEVLTACQLAALLRAVCVCVCVLTRKVIS